VIPLAIPNLAGNEARYLQECVETNFVSSVGPFVSRFEDLISRASGARQAVATSAGTTGLHAALIAAGVRRDELVILPSFTFIASANAIAHCGATPWLFDITAESWTLDPHQVARAIEAETDEHCGAIFHKATGRRVAAMMPVYTLGIPADMDRLVEISRRYRLPIVADGAAALGALYKDRPVGNIGADLTVFSFNGNKTVTAGGGGAVAGNDEALCGLVRHLTTTARTSAQYDHDMVGFNYRMTNLQAAVGCAQLEHLDKFVAAKRRICSVYKHGLADLPGIGFFANPGWAKSACWFSGITVTEPSTTQIIPILRNHGIDARPFWKPIHLQPPYAGAPRASLSVSDDLWSTVLTLPCSTSLTYEDQRAVIAAVRRCFRA